MPQGAGAQGAGPGPNHHIGRCTTTMKESRPAHLSPLHGRAKEQSRRPPRGRPFVSIVVPIPRSAAGCLDTVPYALIRLLAQVEVLEHGERTVGDTLALFLLRNLLGMAAVDVVEVLTTDRAQALAVLATQYHIG